LTLTLEDPDSAFTLNGGSAPVIIPSIAPGGRPYFELAPRHGLPARAAAYTATVRITGSTMITPLALGLSFKVLPQPAITINPQSSSLYFGQGGNVDFNIAATDFGTSPQPNFSPTFSWDGAAPAVNNVSLTLNSTANTGATLRVNISPLADAGTYRFIISSPGAAPQTGELVINSASVTRIHPDFPIQTPTPITAYDARNATNGSSLVALANLPSTVTVQLSGGGTATLGITWAFQEGSRQLPPEGGSVPYLITGTVSQSELNSLGVHNVSGGFTTTVNLAISQVEKILPVFSDITVTRIEPTEPEAFETPQVTFKFDQYSLAVLDKDWNEVDYGDINAVLPDRGIVIVEGEEIHYTISWSIPGTYLNVSEVNTEGITVTGVVSFPEKPNWLYVQQPTALRQTQRIIRVETCNHPGLSSLPWIIKTNETCTTDGLEYRTCTVCYHVQTQVREFLGHDWQAWLQTREPTCVNTGEEKRDCARCNHKEIRPTGPFGGAHIMGAWEQSAAATCTASGTETRVCINPENPACGFTETKPTEKTAHNFSDAVIITIRPPACLAPGADAKTCVECGAIDNNLDDEISVEPLGHAADFLWVETIETTCTTDGLQTRTCSRCGLHEEEVITSNGHHVWNAAVTLRSASCTQVGLTTQSCQNCSETLTATLPRIDHAFPEDWPEPNPAATCTTAGARSRACAICQTLETQTIDELGHAWGDWQNTVAPTCTSTGIRAHVCGRCSISEADPNPVPATGHIMGQWSVHIPATVTAEGEEISSCLNNCGFVEIRAIPRLSAEPSPPPSTPAPGSSWPTDSGGSGDDTAMPSPARRAEKELGSAGSDGGENRGGDGGSPNRPSPNARFPFADVENHWAAIEGDIEFLWRRGIIRGVSDTAFAPDTPIVRAMLLAMLFRLEGEPHIEYYHTFDDVRSGVWYSEPVVWAFEHQIAQGSGNNMFEPDTEMTREQIITMLHRYAAFKQYDVTAPNVVNASFDDFDNISAWALAPMRWAIRNGLIYGFDGHLQPHNTATRAEAAALLTRFMLFYGI